MPYNAEEVVFSISGSTAVLADEIALAEAGSESVSTSRSGCWPIPRSSGAPGSARSPK